MPEINLELKSPGELLDEIVRLQAAIKDACDLLTERTQGSPAKSAGHQRAPVAGEGSRAFE